MRRKRYQKGSLQKKRQGSRLAWLVQYRDPMGVKRHHTLGLCSSLSRRAAEAERAEFMAEVNADRDPKRAGCELTLRRFVQKSFYPHKEARWKGSTRTTTVDRIDRHILGEIGDLPIAQLDRKALQRLLDRKAQDGLGRSMVNHLRFDLGDIFELAEIDGEIAKNPTGCLYTPGSATVATQRVMTADELKSGMLALDLRERVIWALAGVCGMRPGEILALQRQHVEGDRLRVEQRVYHGRVDTPKTPRSIRTVALPKQVAAYLETWMMLVDESPSAWLFPSERGCTPLRPENLWRSCIGPRLEPLGLGWVNFQVLRRTSASLAHAVGVDPKIRADQMGNGIRVNLDEYTVTNLDQRRGAAQRLEDSILS